MSQKSQNNCQFSQINCQKSQKKLYTRLQSYIHDQKTDDILIAKNKFFLSLSNRSTLEGAVKKMLEEKIKGYKDLHINLSYKVLVGDPTDQIITYAEESGIDLIVMSSRRITTIVRAIGSTVRKVINNSRKPVLVIHE